MSLATERERAVVWSGGKCTRQSLLDLNVNTQPLPVLPLKVTLVTLEHCTDHSEGESLVRGERKDGAILRLGSAGPCTHSLLPKGRIAPFVRNGTDRAVFLVTGCCSTLQVVNKLYYNVQEVLLKFCISERKTSESVSTPKSRSECKFEPVVSF